jgi:hypothetical protein
VQLSLCSFLCKAYARPVTNDAVMVGGVHRPNHGLAHSLRVCMLVPIIAALFCDEKLSLPGYSSDIFDAATIEMLQVCCVFSVVGRQDESGWEDNPALYDEFHRTAGDAFRDYSLSISDGDVVTSEMTRYSTLVQFFSIRLAPSTTHHCT